MPFSKVWSESKSTSGNGNDTKDEDEKMKMDNFKVINQLSLNDVNKEPLKVRASRVIGMMAGLPAPPTPQDYNKIVKKLTKEKKGKEPTNMEILTAANNANKLTNMLVLNAHTVPYDAYRLIREGSFLFVFFLATVIILISSMIFATWGKMAGCIPSSTYGFIPRGFMVISGLGTEIRQNLEGNIAYEDISDACLWMETLGVLFGVYTLLPSFGALVLVRLLDNRKDLLNVSDVLLLTKRYGRPCIQFRVASATGNRLHNLECSLTIVKTEKDAETGEDFVAFVEVPLEHPRWLEAYALTVTHVVDENSPLLKKGREIIVFDDKNVPRFHPNVLLFNVSVHANQEFGGRTTISYKQGMKDRLIQPNEKAHLPSWKACMLYTPLDWGVSNGYKVPTCNMSAISDWEYNQMEPPKNNDENV